MHSLIGNYPFTVDAYLTDFRGKATLPLLSSFILRVATKHADERGFGYAEMTSKNLAWVLSRLVIEVFEYPESDAELNVKTWVADANKFFTERCICFENRESKVIAFARTVWAAIDMDTRRPTNVLELNDLTSYITEQDIPIDGTKKIPALKEEEPVGKFTVRYSDVDINGHLNSMKYIEHFIDIFDMELFKEKDIHRFEINYLQEVRFGTGIRIYQREEENNVYILEMKDKEGKIISSARIYWK